MRIKRLTSALALALAVAVAGCALAASATAASTTTPGPGRNTHITLYSINSWRLASVITSSIGKTKPFRTFALKGSMSRTTFLMGMTLTYSRTKRAMCTKRAKTSRSL